MSSLAWVRACNVLSRRVAVRSRSVFPASRSLWSTRVRSDSACATLHPRSSRSFATAGDGDKSKPPRSGTRPGIPSRPSQAAVAEPDAGASIPVDADGFVLTAGGDYMLNVKKQRVHIDALQQDDLTSLALGGTLSQNALPESPPDPDFDLEEDLDEAALLDDLDNPLAMMDQDLEPRAKRSGIAAQQIGGEDPEEKVELSEAEQELEQLRSTLRLDADGYLIDDKGGRYIDQDTNEPISVHDIYKYTKKAEAAEARLDPELEYERHPDGTLILDSEDQPIPLKEEDVTPSDRGLKLTPGWPQRNYTIEALPFMKQQAVWDKLPDPYAEPRDPAHKDLPLDAIKDLYFPDKVPFGNIVRQGNGPFKYGFYAEIETAEWNHDEQITDSSYRKLRKVRLRASISSFNMPKAQEKVFRELVGPRAVADKLTIVCDERPTREENMQRVYEILKRLLVESERLTIQLHPRTAGTFPVHPELEAAAGPVPAYVPAAKHASSNASDAPKPAQ